MIILDLDNCISDDEWRIGRIGCCGPNRFHHYHSLSPWDEYKNRELVAVPLINSESISILTARPVLYRELTVEWLRRHNIPWRHLLMRNNHDMRHSLEIKQTQVRWLLDHYDVPLSAISIAYDDRTEVVDMYRAEYGIRAEVRAIHSAPYAYKDPAHGYWNHD